MKNVENYKLLYCDTDFVRKWCLDNSMKFNIGKTEIILKLTSLNLYSYCVIVYQLDLNISEYFKLKFLILYLLFLHIFVNV
jgi:hypothetical protein